jgi:sulfate adenylyltransferase subunit 1
VLKDEIDISRGDLLVDAQDAAGGAKRQHGCGVDGRAGVTPGQSYDIKIAGKKTARASTLSATRLILTT